MPMEIVADSRRISPGDTFIAVPGAAVDGRHYVQSAIDQGAAKIYYEAIDSDQFILPSTDIPLIPIENLNEKQGLLAAEFYGFPSRQLNLIGVTGTNGKTSVTHFLAQCLEHSAVIGTAGFGPIDALQKNKFTTPMAPDVQRLLAGFVKDGIKNVAMEVSSHALDQNRVAGCEFAIAVFTNLTRDHLDYHESMQAYARAKQKLFTMPGLHCAVVNSVSTNTASNWTTNSVAFMVIEYYRIL